MSEWPGSNTFRLGDQHNVLIRDNRVDEFDKFTPGERERIGSIRPGANMPARFPNP